MCNPKSAVQLHGGSSLGNAKTQSLLSPSATYKASQSNQSNRSGGRHNAKVHIVNRGIDIGVGLARHQRYAGNGGAGGNESNKVRRAFAVANVRGAVRQTHLNSCRDGFEIQISGKNISTNGLHSRIECKRDRGVGIVC